VKLVVTGANGFVGAHLVETLLQRGHAVRALVRKTSDLTHLPKDRVELAHGDVTAAAGLPSAMAGIDVVFHVAGVTKARSLAEFMRVNCGGTANVMSAAAEMEKPPKVVFVSSIAAAGPCGADRPLQEGDACKPVSRYGTSKAAAEEKVREYAGKVPVSIVRPPIVYGPRDRDVFELFKMAAGGLIVQAGFAARRFSVVHVQDLAVGLALVGERGDTLANDDAARGLYYVAHDGPFLWRELGEAAAAGFGRRARTIRVPDLVTFIAAYIGELIGMIRRKPFVVNLDKAREGTAGNWGCSSARARELGFSVAKPLNERFRETAVWYRENGWI
jgi:nucleoside-diphosphate-sugar epimerase